MALELTDFDAAQYLTDTESIKIYLGDAFANEDVHGIVDAISVAVRARGGVTRLASETGLEETIICRALNESDSHDFGAILAVLHGLGIRLTTSLVA